LIERSVAQLDGAPTLIANPLFTLTSAVRLFKWIWGQVWCPTRQSGQISSWVGLQRKTCTARITER